MELWQKAVADGKVRFIKNGIETDRFKFDEKQEEKFVKNSVWATRR